MHMESNDEGTESQNDASSFSSHVIIQYDHESII